MGSSGDVNWKLADHPKLPKGKTIGLIVLDGWGESDPDQYNCIHKAPTPAMDSLKDVCFLFCLYPLLSSMISLDSDYGLQRFDFILHRGSPTHGG